MWICSPMARKRTSAPGHTHPMQVTDDGEPLVVGMTEEQMAELLNLPKGYHW